MAVVPGLDQLGDGLVQKDDSIRVPLFIVRIDGIIYNTGMCIEPLNDKLVIQFVVPKSSKQMPLMYIPFIITIIKCDMVE